MNRTQEGQFLDLVEQVLRREQTSLRRLCKKRQGLSPFNAGIASRCMERELLYLIYKKLLGNESFYKWTILPEDFYPDSNRRSDIMMTNEKVPATRDPNDIRGPWDCIEFGYYSPQKMEQYIAKLKRLKTTTRFQCGERYIVIFKWHDEDEGYSLKKDITDTDSYKNGKIEWASVTQPIRWVRVPKYRVDDNKDKSVNGIFEIAFLKLPKLIA